jgi:PAS domain S-box-containing protein
MKERVNILLVDDHSENLLALKAILEELDENIVTAESGFEALRYLLEGDFAVILLDVQMPGMDGFETAALIRQRATLQHTPIIFLTAIDKNEQAMFRGYAVGAVDYLFKPFPPEVLKAKVAVFIELYRKTQEIRRQADLLHQTNRELGKTNKVMGALFRQLEERNTEINRERDFIAAVLETAGSFVAVLEPDATIVRFNTACERIIGISSHEAAGQNFIEQFIDENERTCVRDCIDRILAGEHPVECEYGLRTPEGARRVIAWSNTAIYDGSGQARYVIFTGVDITDRKHAEDEIRELNTDLEERVEKRTSQLEEANKELTQEVAERRRAQRELEIAKEAAEAANSAKDRFLAVLSHELRTPLTPVLASIEVVQDDPTLSDSIRERFQTIRRNVELEAQLIDDLLDLTRIAKGKLQLTFEHIDAHALLRNVLEICETNAREKNITVDVDLGAEAHWLRGDSARLQQVFWNLVKNAIKFTPEGGRIRIASRELEGNRIALEVTDTGIGIQAEALEKIFDAFEQASRDITRLFGGLGLGLSISKALVEAHGGEIFAGSEGDGRGATFSVVLPVEREGEQKKSEPTPQRTAQARQGIHILIVEDHRETNLVMQMFLERQGYRVSSARTVTDALELATATNFDVVISDISLPDGTGLDLMRTLRAVKPVVGIALSGFGMETDIQRSLEAGFVEHLVKPVGVRALQAAIDRAVTPDETAGDGGAEEAAPPVASTNGVRTQPALNGQSVSRIVKTNAVPNGRS